MKSISPNVVYLSFKSAIIGNLVAKKIYKAVWIFCVMAFLSLAHAEPSFLRLKKNIEEQDRLIEAESRAVIREFGDEALNNVFVNSFNGQLLLTGVLSDQNQKNSLATQIAKKTKGIKLIVNQIEIGSSPGFWSKAKDKALAITIRDRLTEGFNKDSKSLVYVVVNQRAAYLLGLVSQDEGGRITEIVRRSGPEKVIKVFEYLQFSKEESVNNQTNQVDFSGSTPQTSYPTGMPTVVSTPSYSVPNITNPSLAGVENLSDYEKRVAEEKEAKKRQSDLDNQFKVDQQQSTTTQAADNFLIGKRIALVVGNSNYKHRPLRNPGNDADDISRALRSSGFEVIDLRDASLQQMRAGVRQFGDRLINNDVGLVYYSGHGVEVKGRNYFIPVNADIMREDEIADQGLDVSLILEKMGTAGKGVNILIVDACRDDPFGRSFRSSSRGLAQMDAPRGTIIAYATSPGKVAADGDGRNSPYTKNLVKAMQQPNKPIEQVFKEVRRAVQEETKNQQTPWENTSLSGDFYFRVRK